MSMWFSQNLFQQLSCFLFLIQVLQNNCEFSLGVYRLWIVLHARYSSSIWQLLILIETALLNGNGAQCSQFKFNSLTLELIRWSVRMRSGPPRASVSAFSRLPSTLSPSQVLAKKKVRTQNMKSLAHLSNCVSKKINPTTSYNQWRFPLETLMLFGKIVNAKTLMPCCPNAKKRYIIGVFGGSVDTFFVWKCLDGLKMRCLLTKT